MGRMTQHSVAEAKNRLPELIDRALRGEDVVITRHGHAVVELRPVASPPRPVTAADLDWLAEWRSTLPTSPVDGASLVSQMRDEDER
jgi:prevent-host-death family protein